MESSLADTSTFTFSDGLTVHRLGFGAMRITGEGVWGYPDDLDEAKRVLRRAVELGVDLIDTADAYGPDTSEELIADALAPYPEGLVIATKGGKTRSGPGQWHTVGSPEHLRRALEGSLRRLRLERIDLYQLHAPDPDVPFEETMGALVEMKREGLIRHLGLSNVTLEHLETARATTEIASVQNRYNLTDRDSDAVLDACEEHHIAFIPWYPLATGDLAGAGSAVARLADRLGASPSQVALAWLLHRSPVVLPIPGTSSVAHLEQNLGAARLELSADDMRELGAVAAG